MLKPYFLVVFIASSQNIISSLKVYKKNCFFFLLLLLKHGLCKTLQFFSSSSAIAYKQLVLSLLMYSLRPELLYIFSFELLIFFSYNATLTIFILGTPLLCLVVP